MRAATVQGLAVVEAHFPIEAGDGGGAEDLDARLRDAVGEPGRLPQVVAEGFSQGPASGDALVDGRGETNKLRVEMLQDGLELAAVEVSFLRALQAKDLALGCGHG
jgi:hypothetical protein